MTVLTGTDRVSAAVAALRATPGDPVLRLELARAQWDASLPSRARELVESASVDLPAGRLVGWGVTEPTVGTIPDASDRYGSWGELCVGEWHIATPDGDPVNGGQFQFLQVDTLRVASGASPLVRDLEINWNLDEGHWSALPSADEELTGLWCQLWGHEVLELIAVAESPLSNSVEAWDAAQAFGVEHGSDLVELLMVEPYWLHPLWPHYHYQVELPGTTDATVNVTFRSGVRHTGTFISGF